MMLVIKEAFQAEVSGARVVRMKLVLFEISAGVTVPLAPWDRYQWNSREWPCPTRRVLSPGYRPQDLISGLELRLKFTGSGGKGP